MSFTFPSDLWYPTTISLAFPLILLLVTRLGSLRGRNAAQFLVATLIQVLAWFLGSLVLPHGFRPAQIIDWVLAAMILASALLIYLEIWALLSRGYTLSMATTLRRAGGLLPAEEIARSYRGGLGLEWIMRHRIGGLMAAGLVRRTDRYLVLTSPLGLLAVLAYKIAIAAFGLRKTG
jgi:hypothetical protein